MMELKDSDDLLTAILRTRGKLKYNIPPLTKEMIEEINKYDFTELKKIGMEKVCYFESETYPHLVDNAHEGWKLAYLYKPEFGVPLSFTKRFSFSMTHKEETHYFSCSTNFTGGDIYIQFIKPILFVHYGKRRSAGLLGGGDNAITQIGRFDYISLPATFRHSYEKDGETKVQTKNIRYINISRKLSIGSFHPHVSSGRGSIGRGHRELITEMDEYSNANLDVAGIMSNNYNHHRQSLCTGNMFENVSMEGILNISGFLFRLHKMYFEPNWPGAYTSLNHFQNLIWYMVMLHKKPWEEAYKRLREGNDNRTIDYTITPADIEEMWDDEVIKENIHVRLSDTPVTDWSVDFSLGNFAKHANPTEEIPGLDEYFSRFSGMQDIYKTITMGVSIIGLGNLGSRLAVDLKNMGFEKFNFIDEDRVEKHNLYTQTYDKSDVGFYKTEALSTRLRKKSIFGRQMSNSYNYNRDIRTEPENFTYLPMNIERVKSKRYFNKLTDNPFKHDSSIYNYNIFIVATDNMESRKEAWSWVKEWGLPTWIDTTEKPEKVIRPIYIDVRMGKDFVQVWAFNPNCPIAVKGYEKILEVKPFTVPVCGETSHNYMGTTVSAIVQRVLINYMKDEEYPYMTHVTNNLQIHTRHSPDEEPVPQRVLIYKPNVANETEADYNNVDFYYHPSETNQYDLFKYLKERLGEEDIKKLYKTSDWFAIVDHVRIRTVNAFPSGKTIQRGKYKDIRPIFQHNFGGGWSYSRRLHPAFKEKLEDGSYCEHCSAKPFKNICDEKGCLILSDDNIKIKRGYAITVEGLEKLQNIHKINKFFKM